MRLSALLRAAGVFVAAFATVSPAAAQPDGSPSSDQYYLFKDDVLDGNGLDSTPPIIKTRKLAARVTLIRARASFVGEMLKSVEQL